MGEVLRGSAQQAADAAERVALAAAAPNGLLLDAATDIIDGSDPSLVPWKKSDTPIACGLSTVKTMA